jgi:hypothetical protein
MRTVDQVPGLVPNYDVNVYIVLDHFGRLGSAYRETDEEQADLDNVINNMLHGEYNDQSAWSHLTLPRNGRQMFPRMSLGRFSGAPLVKV